MGNSINTLGLTPLQYAVLDGDAALVKKMLRGGADIFEKGSTYREHREWHLDDELGVPGLEPRFTPRKAVSEHADRSPLRIAFEAKDENSEIWDMFVHRIETVLTHADDATKAETKAALAQELVDMAGVHRPDRYLDYIKALLDLQADPFTPGGHHFGSAMAYAIDAENEKLLDTLVRHNRTNMTRSVHGDGDANTTPAHYAASQDKGEALKIIFKARPDLVHQKNAEGKNPVMVALERGNKSALRAMKSYRAPLHYTDKNGGTALHSIVNSASDTAYKKTLVDAVHAYWPELVTEQDDSGDTVFHTLAKRAAKGDAELLEHFIGKLKDASILEKRNKDGHTALFAAATGRDGDDRLAVADLLLDAGARPDAEDKRGWTPLDRLSERGELDTPMVKRLLTGGGSYKKQLAADFNRDAGHDGDAPKPDATPAVADRKKKPDTGPKR